MNKSQCESWFAEWSLGTASFEMMEKINRGTMKGVLDFLIRRAKTNNAIEVIRSNLYINRKHNINEDNGRTVTCEEKIKMYEDLKQKESAMLNNVEENMKKLYALDTTINAFNATMEKKHFITTMRENLTVIGEFLADINALKNKGIVSSEERQDVLNDLLDEALKIFQDIFFQYGAYEPRQIDWSKIDKIIPSILCSQDYVGDIQRWNDRRRRQSIAKVNKRIQELSSSIKPNPLAEWDRLVTQKQYIWTQCHVKLHWKNGRSVDKHRAFCTTKREGLIRAMEICSQFRFFPPDFFSLLLRREELKGQLRLCREILSLNTINLWEASSIDIESDSCIEKEGGRYRKDRKLNSSKVILPKNGVAEDMAVCLLKGWYNTKIRLFTTQDRVRQIFPEVLVPAINALLNRTQYSTYHCSSIDIDESRISPSRSTIQDLSHLTTRDSDTSAKSPKDLFPSINMDLADAMSTQEEIKCQSLKRGSSTADVLRNLLRDSIEVANSFGFS